MARGQLALLFERLQGERRRRERQRKADQKCLREGEPGPRGKPENQPSEQKAGHGELDGAHSEHRPPHLPKALRPQLQPDQKQEHGDAKLGGVPQRFWVGGGNSEELCRAVGPDEGPRQEIAQDRAELEHPRDGAGERRHAQENGELNQKMAVHGAILRWTPGRDVRQVSDSQVEAKSRPCQP